MTPDERRALAEALVDSAVGSPLTPFVTHAVGEHHDAQFGDKPLINRVLKLCEETGEVAGAMIRHSEQRDGRDWTPEILAELGQCFVVMHGIAAKLGADLDALARDSIAAFLHRSWTIGDRCEFDEPPPLVSPDRLNEILDEAQGPMI